MALTDDLNTFNTIEEITELILIISQYSFDSRRYIRRYQSALSKSRDKRKLAMILVPILAITAIKASENAIGRESDPIDKSFPTFHI